MNKLILDEISKYDDSPSFQKTLIEFFSSLDEEILNNAIKDNESALRELLKPNNVVKFPVKWIDDKGITQTNMGYRIQYNNKNGIYKGGLRFHPSVNEDILKLLAFEQTFKNILTSMPMGGAKGGSDFDPKGKSDNEIKNFCYAFMKKLYPYLGIEVDVPAGDIGVGAKEIDFLSQAYKEYSKDPLPTFTGKPINKGGSLGRKEATGYGLVYFAHRALEVYLNTDFMDKTTIVSGSGNVAIYCAERIIKFGGKVLAMSDSSGVIYDESGIDVEVIKTIKEVEKQRINKYVFYKPNAIYLNDPKSIWKIKCDFAFPCATQFEIDENDASIMINNGVSGVFEGANKPCSKAAIESFNQNKVIYGPGKAANAGGVTVSYFEILQNKGNERWEFDVVDKKLNDVMVDIFNNIYNTAKQIKEPFNLLKGANNYSFQILTTIYK